MFDNFRDKVYGWTFGDKKDKNIDGLSPYIKPVSEDAAYTVGAGYYGLQAHKLNLNGTWDNEYDLIRKYRDVAIQQEPDSAVTEIVNEAISGDDDGTVVKINLDALNLSDNIKKRMIEEYNTILQLLDFNKNSYEIFRSWYVDARLYYHIVVDEKKKGLGIQELRRISPLQIRKVREEKTEIGNAGIEIVKEVDEYYLYTPYASRNYPSGLKLSLDSISFTHSGIVDEQTNTIFGWLQKALKPANQIRMMEDAVVIYRLSRAPERRIFYIDVGSMPPGKAAEYLRLIQQQYQNNISYDVITGELKDTTNVMSMMEDFWFPRFSGSKGTEIDTLEGGDNLGKIEDVEYFKKKLYLALNVPIARLTGEENTGAMFGGEAEISRDEQRFSKFVSRLRKRFSNLFLDLLRTQLLLKGIVTEDDWYSIKEKINFDFLSSTAAKEKEETDLLVKNLEILKDAETMVGIFFSKKYLQKKILRMTDEEIKLMDEEIKKELADGELDDFSVVKGRIQFDAEMDALMNPPLPAPKPKQK